MYCHKCRAMLTKNEESRVVCGVCQQKYYLASFEIKNSQKRAK